MLKGGDDLVCKGWYTKEAENLKGKFEETVFSFLGNSGYVLELRYNDTYLVRLWDLNMILFIYFINPMTKVQFHCTFYK